MKKLFSVRTIILAGSLLLQLSTLCFHSFGAAGDVDLSFDPGSGVNGPVNAVVVQPDGKVIIGGAFTTVKGLARPGIARLNADGSGDPTFNPGTNSAGGFALQPDGKIIITRQSTNGTVYTTRLNGDGTLDGSFDAALGSYPYGTKFGHVVVQPDGKVLLGGEFPAAYVDDENAVWYYSQYLVVRLNANGTFDTSFAAVSGSYDPYTDYNISSLVLQPDGKVLIGIGGEWYQQIARLNADGTPDSTFTGTGLNGDVRSVVVQADGKVLIGGYFTAVNGTSRNRIARLNADGSLDTSFNPGIGADGSVRSVALQPDGKVLIGGYFTTVNGTSRNGIARLNADGSLDTSFNPGTGANPVISVGLQPDGKVLIGGWFTIVNGTNRERMARLNANGSLDSTFNPGATIDGGIHSVVVQPDSKVLIGGWFAHVSGTNRNAIARLNANGSLDSTFNPGTGAYRFPDTSGGGEVRSVALQPDGKVLISGLFAYFNGTSRDRIARLTADGSLDGTFNPATANFYGGIDSVVVQPDGKVLIYGFDGLYRINPNGSWDTNFLTHFNGLDFRDCGPQVQCYETFYPTAVVLQSDGKLLVGVQSYYFPCDYYVGGYCDPIETYFPVRLNANGSNDTSFVSTNTGLLGRVTSIVVQPDGKALIGRDVFGASRIVRLNINGSLDSTFSPGTGPDSSVLCIALQPDGKVLIGGDFTSVNGTSRNRIARLNADGSLDSSFNPGTGADGSVRFIALQPDGNVLIGGDFVAVNGVARPHVARLYGDSVAPSLNITRSNAFVIVSWPVTGLSSQLQESTNLSLPNSWSPVTQPAVTNGGQISVNIPTAVGSKFFRLKSH